MKISSHIILPTRKAYLIRSNKCSPFTKKYTVCKVSPFKDICLRGGVTLALKHVIETVFLVLKINFLPFRFISFRARTRLAAIDHNHHCELAQAKNQAGELLYSRRWSKKAGRWVPVIVKEPKDYSYIPYLMALILYTRKLDKSSIKDPVALPPEDPRNIASTIAKLPAKPTKELVAAKKSQFLSKKK